METLCALGLLAYIVCLKPIFRLSSATLSKHKAESVSAALSGCSPPLLFFTPTLSGRIKSPPSPLAQICSQPFFTQSQSLSQEEGLCGDRIELLGHLWHVSCSWWLWSTLTHVSKTGFTLVNWGGLVSTLIQFEIQSSWGVFGLWMVPQKLKAVCYGQGLFLGNNCVAMSLSFTSGSDINHKPFLQGTVIFDPFIILDQKKKLVQ